MKSFIIAIKSAVTFSSFKTEEYQADLGQFIVFVKSTKLLFAVLEYSIDFSIDEEKLM